MNCKYYYHDLEIIIHTLIIGRALVRKNDIDYIADILFRERWNGKSVRELREYCQDWDKTDKYGVDISKLSDGQIERVFVRYMYLYG